jgi:hypothetical protein
MTGVVSCTDGTRVLGGEGAGTDREPPELPDVHAARTAQAIRAATRTGTRPPCHDVPMRIRGCLLGNSQRMICTSRLCAIDTHPAVG